MKKLLMIVVLIVGILFISGCKEETCCYMVSNSGEPYRDCNLPCVK